MRFVLCALITAVVIAIGAAADAARYARPVVALDRYWFGLLRKGPQWTPERTPRTDSIQAGHMENIGRMAESGALIAAGPFLRPREWRGVFIFRRDSLPIVRAMAERDPAIQSGRLVLDLFPWQAPVGIGEAYRRIAKEPGHRDSMVTLQLGMLKRGPKWSPPGSTRERRVPKEPGIAIFTGLEEGDLATAGFFEGDHPGSQFVGVMIFRTDSVEANHLARTLTDVKAGRLEVDVRPWMTAWGTMPGDTLKR